MKKLMWAVALMIGLSLLTQPFSFAKEDAKKATLDSKAPAGFVMPQQGNAGRPGMPMGMGSMMSMDMMMTMQALKDRSVVATSDGGVVVTIGTQMTKYDKDLNVVKETELKIDVDAIRKKMSEMMSHASGAHSDKAEKA